VLGAPGVARYTFPCGGVVAGVGVEFGAPPSLLAHQLLLIIHRQ
jgi:phage shock protein PspC (stress-responsive transcriptional regulator)